MQGDLLRLKSLISELRVALDKGYETPYASINLATDTKYQKSIKKAAAQYKSVSLIIVIGIGGSNLGAQALYQALPKEKNIKPILFADTIDSDEIYAIAKTLEEHLRKKEKVLICLITKSGTTTESIANFQILYNILLKHKKHPNDFCIAITDKDSALHDLAHMQGMPFLEIPKLVGGRYSVFSAVGMFPLAVAGYKVEKILKGASTLREQCVEYDLDKNPSLLRALLLFHQKKANKTIHDLFIFSPRLEGVGKWYRQLMGESIGKQFSLDGKEVHEGITPIVSIGSTDLHSMAQLYLGGPNDKFTTFVSIKEPKHNLTVPKSKQFDVLVPNIGGKKMHEIMQAILQGVKSSYAQDNRPYFAVELSSVSEECLGGLMQMMMIEIMILGSLLNINPFDQPNVESYKKETKALLAKSR